MDEIPEIEPTIHEPDFFDARDDFSPEGHPPGSATLSEGQIAEVANSAPLGKICELNDADDDDLREFNQFLVNLEGGADGSIPLFDENEKDTSSTNVEEGVEESEIESQKAKPNIDAEDKSEENGKNDEASFDSSDKETGINGSHKSSSSNPPTPDSRPGSRAAVVRLVSLPSLPKVSLESKRISIARESPSKDTPVKSPPRMTRGRLNATNKPLENATRETRSKRKFEKEGADEVSPKKNAATRSGRQSRKNPRYVFDEDLKDDDDSGENSDEDYVNDTDSEGLLEPVSKKKKTVTKNYWTEVDGTIRFRDSHGKTITLKSLSIRVKRLSAKDIEKYTRVESLEHRPSPILLEVCIDNFLSAKEAVRGGANRIELCSSLAEGGLTPSTGFLQIVKENFKNTPVFVMIRPRGGDFLYNEEEIEIMCRDISHYKQIGADGFVFGALTKDCEVDNDNCKLLLQQAKPLPCTFHRAFDKVSHPLSALETIINLGFQRILTSGQQATAQAGISTLKRLVESSNGRIIIMAGCGVNESNVAEIVRKTGVVEVHGSAGKSVASIMGLPGPSKSNKRGSKQSAVKMGKSDDSVIKVTDSRSVELIVKNAKRAALRMQY